MSNTVIQEARLKAFEKLIYELTTHRICNVRCELVDTLFSQCTNCGSLPSLKSKRKRLNSYISIANQFNGYFEESRPKTLENQCWTTHNIFRSVFVGSRQRPVESTLCRTVGHHAD